MSSYRNLEALVEKYIHQYQAISLVLDSAQQERDEYRDLYSASHEKLEAARRERDELRGRLTLVREQRDAELNKNLQLEAELARRDAAAGEVIYQFDCGEGWQDVDQTDYERYIYARGISTRKVYTAAQPAVLPPDWSDVPASLAGDLSDAEKNAWLSGANCMRQHCLELCAHEQKPVVLPGYLSYAGIPAEYPSYAEEIAHQRGFYYGVKRCKEALDAAGVKWEVKK